MSVFLVKIVFASLLTLAKKKKTLRRLVQGLTLGEPKISTLIWLETKTCKLLQCFLQDC